MLELEGLLPREQSQNIRMKLRKKLRFPILSIAYE